MRQRPSTRHAARAASVIGVAIVAVYVGLAAVSGGLSPLARRPLLDGLTPSAYRWVNPPPDMAPTNVAPSVLTFSLPLTASGIKGFSEPSGDKQVIVIVSDGMIGPHGSDTTVRFDVTPLDPATLKPLGHKLAAFGNAYRIKATYMPSGAPVSTLTSALDVVLSYPITVSLNTTKHQMAFSPDGTSWSVRTGTEFLANQQVEAQVPGLGYVVVAGIPGPTPVTASPVPKGGGANVVALGLIVAAGCALLVGLGLVLRNRRA